MIFALQNACQITLLHIPSSVLHTGFILEISQWGSNGPPSVILGDPFSRKGIPKKVFEFIGTDCSVRKRTLIDALPHFGTFWATENAWARITAESRMFVWWNNDSKEEEKGNWDSKRIWKFKVSLQSDRQISVVVSDVFEYFISKNSGYPWVFLFCAPSDAAT